MHPVAFLTHSAIFFTLEETLKYLHTWVAWHFKENANLRLSGMTIVATNADMIEHFNTFVTRRHTDYSRYLTLI